MIVSIPPASFAARASKGPFGGVLFFRPTRYRAVVRAHCPLRGAEREGRAHHRLHGASFLRDSRVSQSAFAVVTMRSRDETTTPSGFSTVTAKSVGSATARRAVMGITTSPVSSSIENTPPSTG